MTLIASREPPAADFEGVSRLDREPVRPPCPVRAPEEIAMAAQSKPAPIGPWGRATAGAAGAVFANALVYPLDLYVVFACRLVAPNC